MVSRSVNSLKLIVFTKEIIALLYLRSHLFVVVNYSRRCSIYIQANHLDPYLFTCQPTKVSGVNLCAHLLRQSFSRNYSSFRSGPRTQFSGANLLINT